jgi:hypothetical protein
MGYLPDRRVGARRQPLSLPLTPNYLTIAGRKDISSVQAVRSNPSNRLGCTGQDSWAEEESQPDAILSAAEAMAVNTSPTEVIRETSEAECSCCECPTCSNRDLGEYCGISTCKSGPSPRARSYRAPGGCGRFHSVQRNSAKIRSPDGHARRSFLQYCRCGPFRWCCLEALVIGLPTTPFIECSDSG